METTDVPTPGQAAQPPATTMPQTTATPPTPRREHHAGHIIAIVVGCLMLLPGIGMLVGGGAAAMAQSFATEDGYFRFSPDRIESDGVAIAATDLWLDGDADTEDTPSWLLDALDVDLRLRVSGATPTDDVFVGIGRTPDVERYLSGADHTEVIEMDGHVPIYREVTGEGSVDDPTTVDIWASSVSGDGEQELTWDARGGNWSIVVMNADGSPAVAADVEIGVRSGAVMPVAIFLMVFGGLFIAGAVVLIVVGARGRRPGRDDPSPDPTPSWAAFPPPTPPAEVPAGDGAPSATPVG